MNSTPDIIQEITDLIGPEATERLLSVFGGKNFKAHCYTEEIERLIGEENRQRLYQHFGRGEYYLPMRKEQAVKHRNEAVRAGFDALTKAGNSSRFSVFRLSSEHKISERHVWRILKEPRSSDNAVESSK